MHDTAWVHNLNPFLIRFSDAIGIRWYGLAYLAGFIFGALIIVLLAKRGSGMMRPERVPDFITFIVLGTMLGGRLGYAFFYGPELLTDFSSHFPYWGVLRVWEGGMASHGGIIGVIIASVLFARRYKMNWLHLGDLTTLGGSIGIFFGRIANFINGELFGREAAPWFPFPVKFPTEMYLWLRHDLEAPRVLASIDLLPKMTNTVTAIGTPNADWTQLLTQLRSGGSSAAMRNQFQRQIELVISAIQNGNEHVRSTLGLELTARYPSQLIEATLEGLLLFLITVFFWRKPRKPGVVGAVWLSSYALVRILGEQFRMPDAQIGFQLFGLTRGQWLSIAMLFASAVLYLFASTRSTPSIGGWARSDSKAAD
jgi:phosphatidylglycerol:prolipoprotein diacylglycerol transferase